MKRVLIIGSGSYIARSFEAYAGGRHCAEMAQSRDGAWKSVDFSGYDSVLHCAGLAHAKDTPGMREEYFGVNCDLALEVAKKAKNEKAGQFIYLSSMSVFGRKQREISPGAPPEPDGPYGQSKLKAERELAKLASDDFRVCIVRPPMVYGKGCKGNFPRLVKLAMAAPAFPDFPNKRSMIYIENLCCFLSLAIDGAYEGVFMPQNKEHVGTTELAVRIAGALGKKLRLTKLLNPALRLLKTRSVAVGKLFGDMFYALTGEEAAYNPVSFEDSVERTVK